MWISSDNKRWRDIMDILDFTSHFLHLYFFDMCFFFFLYKIGKKGQKAATLYRFCVSFFTVCLKAQKSFNYYIIKLKSKLAFVILRMILFRSDLDLCLLRWVLFHYRFFQFSSGRISVLCPMYSLVFLPFVVLVGYTKTYEVCVCFLEMCHKLFHLCVLIVVSTDWSFSISLRSYWYPVILSHGCFLGTCSQRPDLMDVDVSLQVLDPYRSIDFTLVLKKSCSARLG